MSLVLVSRNCEKCGEAVVGTGIERPEKLHECSKAKDPHEEKSSGSR